MFWLRPGTIDQCYANSKQSLVEDWLKTTGMRWMYNRPLPLAEPLSNKDYIRQIHFEDEVDLKLFKLAFGL